MKVLQIENEKIFQNTNSKNFAALLGESYSTDFSLGDMVILKTQNKFQNSDLTKTEVTCLDYKRTNYVYYVIKPIDTLENICKKFGITKSYVFDKNGCKRFFVGQKIIVGEL